MGGGIGGRNDMRMSELVRVVDVWRRMWMWMWFGKGAQDPDYEYAQVVTWG